MARALVDAVRGGQAQAPFDSALNVIARHLDADGQPIDRKHAAVEPINFLRPTVAVARYIAFAVLAMHEHPACRERIAAGDDAYLTLFVQEVWRYYPFLPAIGGRALHGFDWHGMHIEKGTWVLLDLYGTDMHPAIWGDPGVFRPERFERFESSGFDLVKSAAKLFATAIDYEVPPQDLSVGLRRIPTLPASGMLIGKVRMRT